MNYAVAGLRPADKQCFDSATRRKTQTSESSHTETFSLLEYKNRGTRPRFLWFCKAKPISSSHAAGMTVAHTPCALFPPNLAFGKEGGQACRSRPRKILHKSPALPDFYAAARAAAARTPLPCRGEGGIVSGFFGTGGVSRGDSVPPGSEPREHKKRADAKHLLSGNSILAELLLLSACSLRLLAALDARAFIMLTLAELGKRTRLGTRTLEATQCAVNRLIFLDADLRHSFPSLRTFPSWGSLSTVCIHPYTKP